MPISARRFALRVLLFSLPIIFVIGLLEVALWQTGETVPVGIVIARQRKNPKIVWLRTYFDQGLYASKWRGFETQRPRVIALGSSRVLKFRQEMFGRDGAGFFNAGRMIQSVEDLNVFADELTPASTPRVALIGVDFWWLNANRTASGSLSAERNEDGVLDWRAHWLVWREMLSLSAPRSSQSRSSQAHTPLPMQSLLTAWRSPAFSDALGIQARIRGDGFRFDGSKNNKIDIPARIADWDLKVDKWKEKIAEGQKEVVFTTGVSAARLARLRQALMTLQKKGVVVLVFNPPLISTDAKLMNAMPTQQRLWREYQTLVPQLCRELKIPFCDASTPQKLGLADYYMADAVHAEETFHLYILRSWMKNPVARRALPDVSKVTDAILASPRTHFWMPDYTASPFAFQFQRGG